MHFKKKNREAYTNFLRAKYEAYTGATTVRSYPYYLLIDPADICQLRCPTCPTGIDNENRRGKKTEELHRGNRAVMKPDMFNELLDEVGPYLFHLMLYNWGEPLLNQHITDFVKKAHTYDIETAMHTNLSLKLSQQRIDEVLSSGLDTLTASIDGFSQEAYEIHRVGGNIDLVKQNLEALVAAKHRLGLRTQITYKMLVFGHNEHEIPLAEQYCKDIGVAFAYEDGVVPDQSWMTKERLKKLPKGLGFDRQKQGVQEHDPQSEEAQEQAKKAEEILASTNDTAIAEDEADLSKKQARLDVLFSEQNSKGKHAKFCTWHYGYSVITAGGSVAPCCSTGKESADFGIIAPGESSFADVWNNDKFRHVRGAYAGSDVSDTADVTTICEPCHFPRFVQQLYSIHDPRLIATFQRKLADTEPVLQEAFRLLSRKRYGYFKNKELQRGEFTAKILSGGPGNERKMSAFIKYFEEHLAHEPAAQDIS